MAHMCIHAIPWMVGVHPCPTMSYWYTPLPCHELLVYTPALPWVIGIHHCPAMSYWYTPCPSMEGHIDTFGRLTKCTVNMLHVSPTSLGTPMWPWIVHFTLAWGGCIKTCVPDVTLNGDMPWMARNMPMCSLLHIQSCISLHVTWKES